MKSMITGLALFLCTAGHSQRSITVYFDFNKYNITEAAKTRLDSFLYAEKQNLPRLAITLSGHCDVTGNDIYNDKLSEQRVMAVKNYLLNNGVSSERIISAKGYGKRELLNGNATAEERQMNRRVEISYTGIALNNSGDGSSLKEKIADTATTSGTNIVLRNINFYGGMHQFLPESTPMLEELLDAMRTYPKLVIRIEGHICCQADNSDGLDGETGLYNLSEARAKAIRDYLIQNDIPEGRVSYKGFGHSSPIHSYPEKTEEERIQNRRVEIKIISK